MNLKQRELLLAVITIKIILVGLEVATCQREMLHKVHCHTMTNLNQRRVRYKLSIRSIRCSQLDQKHKWNFKETDKEMLRSLQRLTIYLKSKI